MRPINADMLNLIVPTALHMLEEQKGKNEVLHTFVDMFLMLIEQEPTLTKEELEDYLNSLE